jgi:hypothetical protein
MPLLPPHLIVGTRGIGVVKRSYAHPVELNDNAFGIANSKSSSKFTEN